MDWGLLAGGALCLAGGKLIKSISKSDKIGKPSKLHRAATPLAVLGIGAGVAAVTGESGSLAAAVRGIADVQPEEVGVYSIALHAIGKGLWKTAKGK